MPKRKPKAPAKPVRQKTSRAPRTAPVSKASRPRAHADVENHEPANRELPPIAEVEPGSAPSSAAPFTVIGIGASAGGFEAFSVFVANLPPDLGVAFVLIQHLDPNHESRLTELLARVSKVPVKEIKQGMKLEVNTIFILPPNVGVTMADGRFRLTPRSPAPAPMPIDVFFRR